MVGSQYTEYTRTISNANDHVTDKKEQTFDGHKSNLKVHYHSVISLFSMSHTSLTCQTFEEGRERLVTIVYNPWPLPECWQSQSDLSCG